MTEYQYMELARRTYREAKQAEQNQAGIPEEVRIQVRADRRRQWTLPVTMVLGLFFVWLTNGASPLQWLALIAYPFAGLRFLDYFIYLTDKYEWLEFNISETCQQHWQARIAMYCLRVFVAGLLMFGASANVTVMGTAPGWVVSGNAEPTGDSHTSAGSQSIQKFIFEFPDDGGDATDSASRRTPGARPTAPTESGSRDSER